MDGKKAPQKDSFSVEGGERCRTHRRLYFQRAITEKYYGSISDIKQARLFKLNFNRSDTYNLISTINYYRNNSAWVKNLIMNR